MKCKTRNQYQSILYIRPACLQKQIVKYNIFQYFNNSYLFHMSFQYIQMDIYSRTDHRRDNSDHHFCKDLKNRLKYMQRHTILAMFKLHSKSKVISKNFKKCFFFSNIFDEEFLFRIVASPLSTQH
jgi:hypothetical protein